MLKEGSIDGKAYSIQLQYLDQSLFSFEGIQPILQDSPEIKVTL